MLLLIVRLMRAESNPNNKPIRAEILQSWVIFMGQNSLVLNIYLSYYKHEKKKRNVSAALINNSNVNLQH